MSDKLTHLTAIRDARSVMLDILSGMMRRVEKMLATSAASREDLDRASLAY
jgi:hypothetical protein